MTEKTQTIRISPHIHALAKSAAAKDQIYLQIWVEKLIMKEIGDQNIQFQGIK